jgi:hypothetical protein
MLDRTLVGPIRSIALQKARAILKIGANYKRRKTKKARSAEEGRRGLDLAMGDQSQCTVRNSVRDDAASGLSIIASRLQEIPTTSRTMRRLRPGACAP